MSAMNALQLIMADRDEWKQRAQILERRVDRYFIELQHAIMEKASRCDCPQIHQPTCTLVHK